LIAMMSWAVVVMPERRESGRAEGEAEERQHWSDCQCEIVRRTYSAPLLFSENVGLDVGPALRWGYSPRQDVQF